MLINLNIKYLRKSKGWPQKTLADKIGVVQSQMTKLETDGGVTSDKLTLLSDIFDVSADDLLNRNMEVEGIRHRAPDHANEPAATYGIDTAQVLKVYQAHLINMERELSATQAGRDKLVKDLTAFKSVLAQHAPALVEDLEKLIDTYK